MKQQQAKREALLEQERIQRDATATLRHLRLTAGLFLSEYDGELPPRLAALRAELRAALQHCTDVGA